MAERFARGGRLVALRALAGGALGRAPRRGRVRAPGDRRQARAARDRRWPARAATWPRRSSCSRDPDDIAIAFGADEDGGEAARALARRPRARLPDDRVRRGRRRVGVRAADRRPRRAPGAGRDALPRAVGARPRVLRRTAACSPGASSAPATTPARQLPLPVPGRARGRPRGLLDDVRRSVLRRRRRSASCARRR